MTDLHHRIEHVNGIRIHCVEAGAGPLVLLVHGFPESWYSCRHQLARARRRRLPGRGDRRRAATADRRHRPTIDAYRMIAQGRRQRRARAALGEHAGGRRRPRLGRADRLELGAGRGPTCSPRSPACRCRSRRAATPDRPTRSGRWPATRSSTSSTSRSRSGRGRAGGRRPPVAARVLLHRLGRRAVGPRRARCRRSPTGTR